MLYDNEFSLAAAQKDKLIGPKILQHWDLYFKTEIKRLNPDDNVRLSFISKYFPFIIFFLLQALQFNR